MRVGNDIVDLAASRGFHFRFPRRVLTPREYARFVIAGFSERVLWRFWAAKEAAFKLARQIDPAVSFLAREFEVDLKRRVVTHAGKTFWLRLRETAEFVYAECRDDALARVVSDVGHCRDDLESDSVRRLVLELAQATGLAECGEISLRKDDAGIPFLVAADERLPVGVSLTHHGRFVAAALAR